MKLINNSLGPKAIMTTDRGTVVLAPGASEDLNVTDADAAAIKKFKLLERDGGGHASSLADLQREIASSGPVATGTADAKADDLPAEDDAEVIELRDSTNAVGLQQIAKDEGVDMEGARNKTEAAQRIIAARRALDANGFSTGGQDDDQLPADDDADVVALSDANDAAALRQLAEAEGVELADGDDPDAARKIVAARRAANQ